ncbi:MAG: hypothetical protein ACWGMZ_02390 [Thermoguttaceae bacterium]
MKNRRAIFLPLALALILALGFEVIIIILAAWGVSIYERKWPPRARDYFVEEIQFLKDETPIIIHNSYSSNILDYRDLDGKKIVFKDERDEQKRLLTYGEATLQSPVDLAQKRLPLEVFQRIFFFSVEQPQKTFWYFIHDGNLNGRGYFVGYDALSKTRIGYISRDGFSEEAPTTKECFLMNPRNNNVFAEPYYWMQQLDSPVMMLSGDKLLKIDFQARSVTTLLQATGMNYLTQLGIMNVDNLDIMEFDLQHFGAKGHIKVLRKTDSIELLDANGKKITSFVIPHKLRNAGFDFYYVNKKKAILSRTKGLTDTENEVALMWIDNAGKTLRQEKATLAKSNFNFRKEDERWQMPMFIPAPIGIALGITVFEPCDLVRTYREPSYSVALSRSLSKYWPGLLVVSIISAFLAGICYLRQRRTAQPWTWAWVAFVFLCGVPGILAYFFYRRWPVMEKCPACETVVPHDREACSSCKKEFPLPERKGIEVFA